MWKKIAVVTIGLMLSGVAVLAAWYQIDGQPIPEAAGFLQGDGFTSAVEADGSLVFTPSAPNGRGILIMHGALIKPLAYAKAGAYFAARGYLVYVPNGPARLSINAIDSAAARLKAWPVEAWYMIGHSMGGFTSLELLARHKPKVLAIALWACSMPADFTGTQPPILFLYGDRDGLLPPERLADARSRLPSTTRFELVSGANHQGFALYSHQFFDDEAAISWVEQTDIALARTATFFAAEP